jgi:predicted enzyme involved in methoxymalonyl-ACP biosynthesis
LCGVISIEIEQESAHIVDFVMSCRVMGRSLEELMIHTVAESVRQKHGPIHLVAEYLETERNRPCLDFWENSGFEERRPHEFVWDLAKAYPMPRVFNVTEIAA